MTDSKHSVSACFIGREGERVFTLHFRPVDTPLAHIVYLPPFGEEMNRCRAVVAEQARNFANMGYSCTVLDFFGTGDSEGEPSEASFAIWRQNVDGVIKLRQSETAVPIMLWGLRLGGLLALDFAQKSAHEIQDIILWQPVTSGKRFVTQMLRQRVASLVTKGQAPETTKQIRQRMASGEIIEISGYDLGGELVHDIEQVDLSSQKKLCTGKIFWLENLGEEGQDVSAAVRKLMTLLEDAGNEVELHTFSDPPLWQLHKRDRAPELLMVTGALL